MAIPSSSSITKDTLFSQSHANIYNLISDNVTDPAAYPSGSPTTRKFVYTRAPRNMGRGFAGYPIIIIPPIDLSQNEGVVSGTRARTTYDIEIRIITKDTDTFAAGAEQLNTVSDDVIATLNDNDDVLRGYGMKNMEVAGSYDLTEDDGKTVYMREITLEFNQLQELK